MRRYSLILGLLFVGSACVSSAEHEAVLLDREQLIAELEECRSQCETTMRERETAMTDLQQRLEEREQALNEMRERQAAMDARMEFYRSLLRQFKELMDAGVLDVTIRRGRMVIQLPADVLFASGQARLSSEGQRTILEVGEILARIERSFQIEGHTDNDPIYGGPYPTNWDLGAARAITVVQLLIRAGVPEARLSAASFAYTQPIASNSTREGMSQNRRIEIVVVPELQELPELEELEE